MITATGPQVMSETARSHGRVTVLARLAVLLEADGLARDRGAAVPEPDVRRGLEQLRALLGSSARPDAAGRSRQGRP